MEALKPCPFCGGEAELDSWYSCGMMFEVDCKDRKCTGSVNKFYRTADEAIAAWNQRAERTCEPKHWNNASGVAFARGECSECGGYLLENSETGKPRPYCPHCGSRVVD